ncbi:lipase chaperone [Citrifermentans bremense]|uniref:lipase chaperone n=1 Tax=Citrifermentans bremense TaxID=60035 RepID=UPI00041A70FC|nr:lipase chaperone [Citrifermentans bremense]
MKKMMSAIAAMAVTMSLATAQAAPEPTAQAAPEPASQQGAKEAEAKPAVPAAAKSAAPLRERALRSEIKARGAEMRKKLMEESGAPQVRDRQ